MRSRLIFLFTLIAFLTGGRIFSETVPEVRHNPWSLIIYRPENSSGMNEIRCWLRLIDAETGEDVTYTKIKANYSWISRPKEGIPYQKTYYLSGGMAMHLLIQSGKYKISFYTPPESQNGFPAADGTENARQWESNEFFYDTHNPAKVIFVSPTANENGFYNGGWYMDYKAPPYYQFTKPKMQY